MTGWLTDGSNQETRRESDINYAHRARFFFSVIKCELCVGFYVYLHLLDVRLSRVYKITQWQAKYLMLINKSVVFFVVVVSRFAFWCDSL